MQRGSPWLSVVIPLFNEADSLRTLHLMIQEALGDGEYEVLFIDDGSIDSSPSVLEEIQRHDPAVRVIRFARNFGKAEALATGFREARGQVIVTLDADLQDDPREIPQLVGTLGHGYDLVNGWKQERQDPWTKRIPSLVFNLVCGVATGVRFHDVNSGFKAYRREVVEALNVYGEMHRLLPVLAYWKGFRVAEVPVRHHRRRFGKSKYGYGRFLAGAFDLLTVTYLVRFRRKPLHLFGVLGGGVLGTGLLINLYLTAVWLLGQPIGTRPLLQLGVLLMVTGVQFLSMGLLGEMITLGSLEREAPGHRYEVIEPRWSEPQPHPVTRDAAVRR